MTHRGRALAPVLVVAALAMPGAAQDRRGPTGTNAPPNAEAAARAAVDDAFAAAYQLDYEQAIVHARQAVALAPESSAAHRGLAAILWQKILFDRGAMTVDHYLGNLSKAHVSLPKPDPAVAAEVRQLLERAIALAESRLDRHPNDLDARFNKGSAYGVLATYVASVEGSLLSSFRIARRAYDAQESVLDRDPSRVSAGLIVGMYRYVVSTMPWHMRMLAYIAGFGGGKERGIQMIEQAATDPRSAIDAKSALVILYSREGRYDDALRLTRELSAEVPRNRLFVLEEGATAIRAGKHAEAETALTRGLAVYERDARPKLPGERSLLLYKRGLARVELGRTAAATSDLRAALAADPPGWIGGRVHLELGRVADIEKRRADAVTAYRAARTGCQAHEDKWCVDLANRYIRQPFAAGRR